MKGAKDWEIEEETGSLKEVRRTNDGLRGEEVE